MLFEGYWMSGNQIRQAPAHLQERVEVSFEKSGKGWVSVTCKRWSWSYSPREERWSYGQQPSDDESINAQIVAGIREFLAPPPAQPPASAAVEVSTVTPRHYQGYHVLVVPEPYAEWDVAGCYVQHEDAGRICIACTSTAGDRCDEFHMRRAQEIAASLVGASTSTNQIPVWRHTGDRTIEPVKMVIFK